MFQQIICEANYLLTFQKLWTAEISDFGKDKGEISILSLTKQTLRPAPLRGYSGQPSHAHATLRGTIG